MAKGIDFDKREKKYVLVEFPYPSGEGLHVGHAFSMTGADVYARFLRKKGFNVMFPMGFDAFGLPSENYAIKTGIQPQVTTDRVTKLFRAQMDKMGFSFDWDREVNTTLPNYYKWTQWIFIKLFEKGLAFKKEMPINWCPSCKIGLANEEVIDGNCERCGTETSKRNISQWVVKITAYADRLLEGLKDTDFIEKVKAAQVNWIGKKVGAKIKFGIKGRDANVEVFTTRLDTIFGATFMVVAPEHPLVAEIKNNVPLVQEYLEKIKGKTEIERTDLTKEKNGVFSELYAINPLTKKEIPVWIADYVLVGYGTGAIMAVPAHDERDFAFAKKYTLDITPVILPQRYYVDENAKGYYDKRQKKNKEFLKKFNSLALANDKSLLINGGWAATIQVGFEYRECEDIDIAILKSERDWWNEQFEKEGFTVGPIFGQNNPDVYYQAVKNPNGDSDTHFDIDVVENGDGYEEKSFEGEKFMVQTKDLIVNEKRESLKEGKEKRWKEISDFLMLGYEPSSGDGVLTNSQEFNGLSSREATQKILELLKEKNLGEKSTTYHLRDWIFSRQHYWGEPIPMVWCENCKSEGDGSRIESGMTGSWVPVPEKDLPVVLPEVEKYQPTETGESPLAAIESFVKTTCPKCGGEAKRETDTMPNWAGSDWYFLRYCDNKNENALADMEKMKYWLPVDVYVGGDEHNTLHLLYSRFIYQFLWDLGAVPKEYPEPYKKRLSHGVILAPDGKRMSKSKGNVIAPEAMIEKYGTDVVRTYMMFMGPFDATMAWNERSLVGVKRFIEKFSNYVEQELKNSRTSHFAKATRDKQELKTEQELSKSKILVNKLVKMAGEDLGEFKFNTVVAKLMETLNNLQEAGEIAKEDLEKLIIVLSVFAPFVTEELWKKLGNTDSVHDQLWPEVDKKYLLEGEIDLSVQINGKLRSVVKIRAEDTEEEVMVKVKADEKVQKYLEGMEIVKEIYIKGRTVSLVVR